MPSLMDKLRMIDTVTKPKPILEEPASDPVACYHRSDRFPLSSFCDFRHMSAKGLSEIFGLPIPQAVKPQDLLFLDTETTGLSGGAGTLAFEVGLGYISSEAFVVEQFLMRDYPEEPLMLTQVSKLMSAFPVLVTFNGRTFDVPLLQNRFLMNRMPESRVPGCHADMLPASRRVWKLRLGRCNLQRLESAILGVERTDDLPGGEVPQTFFTYLKNKDFGPIDRILDHNRQDVVSLAQLFFFLCRFYDKPETAVEPDDLLALAKAAGKRGNAEKAKKCYRLAAQEGRHTEAFTALAAQEKREGRAERAVKLYASMLSRSENPVAACEALAKLYEHQLRSPEQALIYTRQALLLLSEPQLYFDEAVQSRRNALQYRYARLHRKLASADKSQEDEP